MSSVSPPDGLTDDAVRDHFECLRTERKRAYSPIRRLEIAVDLIPLYNYLRDANLVDDMTREMDMIFHETIETFEFCMLLVLFLGV